ncbi:MAG: DUF58 domain-containing protein [Thermoguttaceae bacterium]|nr:DUF58 domain-containing protein [Thermoguttaceae bacterium]
MFDSQTLKKFEFLSIVSNKTFVGTRSGACRNAKLGGGLEFVDYRDYAYGDDLRNLDWNVYARFEVPLIKRFEEEGDLRVYLFLDCSKSMGDTASSDKFVYAKKVIAALAYISLARSNTVTIVPFAAKAGRFFPPARGKDRFLTVARFLEKLEPIDAQTDITSSVKDALAKIKEPGMAIVVSDFFDKNGLTAALEQFIARRFEPLALQIYEPWEADPKLRGDFVFTDAESGATKELTVDAGVLKRYKERFRRFVDSNRQNCVKRGARFYETSTAAPFESFLLNVTRDNGLG